MRRFGRRWWIPGAVVVVAFGAITTYARPDRARPAVQRLQARAAGRAAHATCSSSRAAAGVDVGEVYEMDASRRTTAANAYVTGLGHTKRVVLYDTLVDDFTPAETRLVVAHELGHVHHHDMRNGLIWLAIVAPFGAGPWRCWRERLAPRGGDARAARGARRRALAGDRRAGDHDGLQPALARRRAPRRRVLARADARPGHASSPSSGGSRSRTSPIPIRPPSRASCSARTRRRWSGSAWPRRSSGEVHRARGRPAPAAVRRRRRALREAAARATRASSWSRCATTPACERRIPRAQPPRAARRPRPHVRLARLRALARGPPPGGARRLLRDRRRVRDRARAPSTSGSRSAR